MIINQRLAGLFILLTVITVSCDNKSTSGSDSNGDKSTQPVSQNISDDNRAKDMLKLIEKIKNDTLKAFLKDQQVLSGLRDFRDASSKEMDTVFFSFFSPQISKEGFRQGDYNDAAYEFSRDQHQYRAEYEGEGYTTNGIFYSNDNIFITIESFENPYVYTYAFLLDQQKEQFTQGIPVSVNADVYRATASLAGDTIMVNHSINDGFAFDKSSFVNGKFVEKFLVKKDTLVLVQ